VVGRVTGPAHVIMCGVSEDHVKCHSQSAVCIIVTANQRVALTSIGKRDLALPILYVLGPIKNRSKLEYSTPPRLFNENQISN